MEDGQRRRDSRTRAAAAASRPRGSVGLRQVAEAAGVSTATVSRAINTPDVVSPALRQKITTAIETLGWVPDGAARALATRRSGTIGAVFPTLTHGDFARAAHAIQSELLTSGYTLLLACSEYDFEQEYQQVRKFVERGVDGLILVGEAHHPELRRFLDARGVPFLQTFTYDPRSHGVCIGPDNRKALFRLTQYLISLGHTRFGVVAQSAHNNDRAEARLAGIRDALARSGLDIRPQHVAVGRWGVEEGRTLFRRIMGTDPAPTAVLCGNPYLAVGSALECQALGLRCPEDVSIAGYDDIEIMSHLPVPITTIRVHAERLGRDAARLMVGRVEGRPIEVPYECEAEIIIRASTAPPAGRDTGVRARRRQATRG